MNSQENTSASENTTLDLVSWLTQNGIQKGRPGASLGAIVLPNGRTAFVKETAGKIRLAHPPRGGSARTTYQSFGSRERLLKDLQTNHSVG